jgi:TetR/AcrR family transcriptional repressor of mexJK operon
MTARLTPARSRKPSLRGRPRDLDKRIAVLAAAKQLFAIDGLHGASMNAIAKLAGVSKVTLYSHFTDKDALFRECIGQACEGHTPGEAYLLSGQGSLQDRLTQIASGFFDMITSAEALSLYRLMAANPRRHRKLSQLFWEAGPEATMRRFAQLMEAATSAGELRVDDPQAAAAHFFFLVKGEQHLQLLIGITDKVSPERRRAHIDDVVSMFLRAYAATK